MRVMEQVKKLLLMTLLKKLRVIKYVETEEAVIEKANKYVNKEFVGDGSVEHAVDHGSVEEASSQ